MAPRFRKGKGWTKLEAILNPSAFRRAVRKHVSIATIQNAKLAERTIRRSLRSGSFDRNAALTIAIKNSSKPLIDKGDLFSAVRGVSRVPFVAFAGILFKDEAHDIAETLHEGRTIGVTPAMRGLFFVLWQASTGRISPSKLTGRAAELFERMPEGWFPLKKSTRAIVIPKRPFIEQAITAELKARIEANWRKAAGRAFEKR